MATSDARVQTDRPGRYLAQLCKHAAAMGRARRHSPRAHLQQMLQMREVRVDAEWSGDQGAITFAPWGRCMAAAEPGALSLHAEAADEEHLARIEEIIARNLERFSRRGSLAVHWRRGAASDAEPSA
jgi:hypothetical protein